MREVSLDTGQKLFEAGDDPPFVYFPGTAVVSVVTVMENGQAVETSTIGSESAPGLLALIAREPSTNRVFTQVAGSAVRASAPALRDYTMQNPPFQQMLLKFALANSAQADLSVACNALHDVQARLARWLLMTQDRVGNHTVPLTQDFLAVMLGVQRTTVTKAATMLKKDGVIDYRRGRIVIADRPRLEAAACECYALGRAITAGLAGIEP